ncbi:MAG TPA: lantibiotic dehydratase [Candidatus Saccharimonadales bacterium]|nr:lantibiotic dehydratase [Candidatus Saccharimonadales bacterium]
MTRLYRALHQAYMRAPILPIVYLPYGKQPMEMSADPLIHEALRAASPSLCSALESYDQLSIKKKQQADGSLLRYLARMSSRSTPFGLFSGVTQIVLGDETRLQLAPAGEHRHRTRLDMDWLLQHVNNLESRPNVRPYLVYAYQHNAVRVGTKYYFEYRSTNGKLQSVSVTATTGLELAIQKTTPGKMHSTLCQEMLAEIPGAIEDEVRQFVDQLIAYGLLRSSLRPPLTAFEPAQYVLSQLKSIPTAQAEFREMRSLLSGMRRYDAQAIGDGERILQDITVLANRIHKSSATVPFDIGLNVHMTDSENMLSAKFGEDAARMAEILFKVSRENNGIKTLASFTKLFISRYGRDRLVPVLEVLNPDLGLGLPEHYTAKKATRSSRNSSAYDAATLDIAARALQSHALVVQLTEQDVERLSNPYFSASSIPESLDIALQVVPTSAKDPEKHDYLVVPAPMVGIHPAGRTAGRFADMLGSDSVQYLQQVADVHVARQPNYLHAELVYMPNVAHTANVTVRPALRQYEIVLDANPSVQAAKTIPLDDIYLGVRNNQFFLWSKTHQSEIVVYSGHMLNPQYAPSVCRFITDVSVDPYTPLSSFSWGKASQLPALPRLMYGQLVLSLAEWKLDVATLFPNKAGRKVGRHDISADDWHLAVQSWRRNWNVPRYVHLAEFDNRLLLDLDSVESTQELLYAALAKGRIRTLRILEALPDPEQAWLKGENGLYAHEFIFQLVRNRKVPVHPEPVVTERKMALPQAPAVHERLKVPADDWLFCKVYMPASLQDACLTGHISQLIEQLHARTDFSWFFIRYGDPRPHVRLRFKAPSQDILQTIMPALMIWARHMVRHGLLQDFSIDTYDREVERYGGLAGMPIAEAIFTTESVFDVQLLKLKERGVLGGLELPLLAALTTEIFLTSFQLDTPCKISWTKDRHRGHSYYAQDYRKNREALLRLFYAYTTNTEGIEPELRTACDQFARRLDEHAGAYRRLEAEGRLTMAVEDILPSIVHMHINRLVGTADQSQEPRILTYAWRTLSDLTKWQHAPRAAHSASPK